MARKLPPGPDADPSSDLRAAFGRSVRALRARAGWTQSELSRRSGIAQEEISRVEHGQLNLTIQTMSRIAEVLGSRVAEMLDTTTSGPKD